MTQTEITRKKLKLYSYIPLACDFQLVEINLRKIVSNSTLQYFREELNRRTRKREKKAKQLQLEKERENAPKFPTINYSLENFPAPETISIIEEAEFEKALQLSLEGEELSSSSSTTSKPINVPKGEWSTPLIKDEKTSPSSPSFLDVATGKVKVSTTIPKNSEPKKSKKGHILFSTNNLNRKRN